MLFVFGFSKNIKIDPFYENKKTPVVHYIQQANHLIFNPLRLEFPS